MGLGLGSCSLSSTVQDWVWWGRYCGAEDCGAVGVLQGVLIAPCLCCVPGRIQPC